VRTLAQQENVLRLVNEAIEKGFWPGEDEAVVRMRCECGRVDCNAYVRMRASEYEQLRAQPRRFVICAGHGTPGIERVVARGEAHEVVEKTGAAGRLAECDDPRADRSEQPETDVD
jgi:hypothetical protein